MADVNKDVIKALTGFDNVKEVPLKVSGVTLKLEIPGAAGYVAAQAYLRENGESDLRACAYVFRHHCLYPNFKDLTDAEIDDVVADMHYKDVATIVLAFYMDVDLDSEEDRQTLEKVFREMGKVAPSSISPEPSDSH